MRLTNRYLWFGMPYVYPNLYWTNKVSNQLSRYFLVTVESEFIPKCDESCSQRDGEEVNHVCPDVSRECSYILTPVYLMRSLAHC